MKTIFVPSDFSKNATTALRYAIRLCRPMNAKLVVFHCAHLSPYILASKAATDEQLEFLLKQDRDYKHSLLTMQVKKAYAYTGIKAIPKSTLMIVESNPFLVENIIETSVRMKADLIVTGTHGATGLNRFFFGSNTAALVSRSEIPVLAVPEKYHFTKVKGIAYSCDLENLENELECILPFAEALKASVDIVHFDYGVGNSKNYEQAREILKKKVYKKIHLVKRAATIEYSLVAQLKKYLAGNGHQWLVMFSKDRGFWEKLFFGGKTESMCYSLKIPLLSFKKG